MTNPASQESALRARTKFHWSFIRIGLWSSLSVLVILIFVGLWSYYQTNQLVRQAQEQSGNSFAVGLANALEENLIVRNYAQLEVALLQAMSSEQIQTALVADADGTILSEVTRNPVTGKPQPVFSSTGTKAPERLSVTQRQDDAIDIVKQIGTTTHSGWVKVQISTANNNPLLKGIHQQLLLIVGLSAIVMFIIVVFTLRNTYSKVQNTQTEIEDLNDSLHTAAFYDPLTQLPNRPLLRDRLNQALALSERSHHQVAVGYLDLDGFKEINDTYGHDIGDKVLVEVAKRLTHQMRHHDTVARIGGDEFVLVINDLQNLSDFERLLDRILVSLAQPIDIGHRTVAISGSIGVAFSNDHLANPGVLIALADKAMYSAKRCGKNRWQIYDVTNFPASM